MKKVLALAVTGSAMLAASSAMALVESKWHFKPYVGIDIERRELNFERGFGDNLFKHYYNQGNLYLGLRIHEYFGIEGGYEAVNRTSHRLGLHPGALLAGGTVPIIINANDIDIYNSTAKLQGSYIDCIGFFPISEKYKLTLIGMAGIARLKAQCVITLLSIETDFGSIELRESNVLLKKKNILRFGFGLQHMIKQNIGIRAMLKWENTNKFQIKNPENSIQTIKMKNSFFYSLGTFVTF